MSFWIKMLIELKLNCQEYIFLKFLKFPILKKTHNLRSVVNNNFTKFKITTKLILLIKHDSTAMWLYMQASFDFTNRNISAHLFY